jgi:TatD DNase family protein
MLIDIHTHLDFPQFDNDRDAVISRAKESGVSYMLNVGSSLAGSRKSVELAKQYGEIFTAVGLHPHEAGKVDISSAMSEIKSLCSEKKVVAIGETGLDYFRGPDNKKEQQDLFRAHIALAKEKKLPLMIHNREASEDLRRIMEEEKAREIGGILHCFSGDVELAGEYISYGYLISVAGQVTFPKADKLRDALKQIPIEKIVLETDAPFLAPQPVRGKRNEPAYVKHTALELSKIYGLSFDDIARITSLNSQKFLNIKIISEEKGVIVYPIRDSLYLNITNRCSNKCVFCIRNDTDFVKGHNLRLKEEPSVEEIISFLPKDVSKYKEIVFCGYGEPFFRLQDVLEISKRIKALYKEISIRINTNGHGALIHKENIVPRIKEFIGEISVSLNVENEAKYQKFCRPEFGAGTYQEIKKFILECKKQEIKVGLTFLDMPGVDISKCKEIAKELGVGCRIRKYAEVG